MKILFSGKFNIYHVNNVAQHWTTISCLVFLFYFELLEVWPSSSFARSFPHVNRLCLVVCPALDCSQLCSPVLVFL